MDEAVLKIVSSTQEGEGEKAEKGLRKGSWLEEHAVMR